jgi:hypothetical protein
MNFVKNLFTIHRLDLNFRKIPKDVIINGVRGWVKISEKSVTIQSLKANKSVLGN